MPATALLDHRHAAVLAALVIGLTTVLQRHWSHRIWRLQHWYDFTAVVNEMRKIQRKFRVLGRLSVGESFPVGQEQLNALRMLGEARDARVAMVEMGTRPVLQLALEGLHQVKGLGAQSYYKHARGMAELREIRKAYAPHHEYIARKLAPLLLGEYVSIVRQPAGRHTVGTKYVKWDIVMTSRGREQVALPRDQHISNAPTWALISLSRVEQKYNDGEWAGAIRDLMVEVLEPFLRQLLREHRHDSGGCRLPELMREFSGKPGLEGGSAVEAGLRRATLGQMSRWIQGDRVLPACGVADALGAGAQERGIAGLLNPLVVMRNTYLHEDGSTKTDRVRTADVFAALCLCKAFCELASQRVLRPTSTL